MSIRERLKPSAFRRGEPGTATLSELSLGGSTCAPQQRPAQVGALARYRDERLPLAAAQHFGAAAAQALAGGGGDARPSHAEPPRVRVGEAAAAAARGPGGCGRPEQLLSYGERLSSKGEKNPPRNDLTDGGGWGGRRDGSRSST